MTRRSLPGKPDLLLRADTLGDLYIEFMFAR